MNVWVKRWLAMAFGYKDRLAVDSLCSRKAETNHLKAKKGLMASLLVSESTAEELAGVKKEI